MRLDMFEYSVPAELRDYPEWHRDRELYGVWIIPVEAPDLIAYLDEVRDRLSDLLHPARARQPHLTLFVCGFEQPVATHGDDFTPERLQRQFEKLEHGKGAHCALPLLPPDSFATAICVPVADPLARLQNWRLLLDAASSEIRQSPYRPHITIGLYRRRVARAEIAARLATLPPPPPILEVRELHYATYNSRDQAGPLAFRRTIRLPDRQTGMDG